MGSARAMSELFPHIKAPAQNVGQRLLLPPLPVPVRAQLAKGIGAREPLRPQAPCVGAIAAPIGKLLERERERAAGGGGPPEPLPRLERPDAAEAAIPVALQTQPAAAGHLWHLIAPENPHRSVLA